MIDAKHEDISISKKCDLLDINRYTYYNKTRPSKLIEDDKYKRLIFKEYLKYPFYGYRKITEALKKKGHGVNRKRVYRLMREMGIQAIYPKPNLVNHAQSIRNILIS